MDKRKLQEFVNAICSFSDKEQSMLIQNMIAIRLAVIEKQVPTTELMAEHSVLMAAKYYYEFAIDRSELNSTPPSKQTLQASSLQSATTDDTDN